MSGSGVEEDARSKGGWFTPGSSEKVIQANIITQEAFAQQRVQGVVVQETDGPKMVQVMMRNGTWFDTSSNREYVASDTTKEILDILILAGLDPRIFVTIEQGGRELTEDQILAQLPKNIKTHYAMQKEAFRTEVHTRRTDFLLGVNRDQQYGTWPK